MSHGDHALFQRKYVAREQNTQPALKTEKHQMVSRSKRDFVIIVGFTVGMIFLIWLANEFP